MNLKPLIMTLAFLCICSCAVLNDTKSPTYHAGPALREGSYIPKGTVEEVNYPCSEEKITERRMIVYLPEGYEKGGRYPVLYLLHGARGYETAWILKGDILRLTDSLAACGSIRPFILVMPNVNQYNDDRDYDHSRYKNAIESLFEVDGTVENFFVSDVVEFVDSRYRTIADKRHRAISGLSVGALQSIYISAENPDCFDYVGMFSPYWKNLTKASPYSSMFRRLKYTQIVQFAVPPKSYLVCIGKTDIFYPHIQCFRKYLNKNGYPYEYIETEGGHDWYNWTYYYCEFAKRCFKD